MAWLGCDRGAGLLAALVVVAGCYEWAPVRPTELPRLSAGARELERADGGRFEVRHRVTAKVDTPYGAVKFAQPRAMIEDDTLLIAGDDGAAAEIPLDQIKGVRVGQISVIDTTTSLVVLGAAITASVLLFLFMQGGTGRTGTGGGIE